MRKIIALFLSVLLIAPADSVRDLVQKSYLDLFEIDEIQRFSANEIHAVEDQIKKEEEAEQARLKKDEERIEKELKAARKKLAELNKKASRDDEGTGRQRAEIHCEVLRLEADFEKTRTEREKGVPIVYQNKFAKLDLIQKWPAIRAEIEQKIEARLARERQYGDIEDIGVRNLGIEDLGDKQQQDIKTGQEAIREMKSQGLMPPEVEDQTLIRYVQNLARTIAENSDLRVPIKVTVLDSMEINAFALPGGFLFVNSGLINKAETESELVGVLAHEIAHAAARHGPRLMKHATISNIVFQAAQVAAIVFTGGMGIGLTMRCSTAFTG